jgi:hypothetical protein
MFIRNWLGGTLSGPLIPEVCSLQKFIPDWYIDQEVVRIVLKRLL